MAVFFEFSVGLGSLCIHLVIEMDLTKKSGDHGLGNERSTRNQSSDAMQISLSVISGQVWGVKICSILLKPTLVCKWKIESVVHSRIYFKGFNMSFFGQCHCCIYKECLVFAELALLHWYLAASYSHWWLWHWVNSLITN